VQITSFNAYKSNFQVVIGQLYLPANTSTLDANGVVYTHSPSNLE
jgi:hypothetical protein